MATIKHCSELDVILEQTNLNKFKLADSLEQHNVSEMLLLVVSAPIMDMNSTLGGWHLVKGVLGNCTWGLTCARGLLYLFSNLVHFGSVSTARLDRHEHDS